MRSPSPAAPLRKISSTTGLGAHCLLNVSAMSAPDIPSASHTAITAPMLLPETQSTV